MTVPQLLLRTLEDLVDERLKTLKWYLTMETVDGCDPIPVSHLNAASRCETVSLLVDRYGEESAVRVTLEALRKMGMKNAAEKLKRAHAAAAAAVAADGGRRTAPAAAAAASPSPAALSAQDGSVIIAPTLTGATSGSWNITINK